MKIIEIFSSIQGEGPDAGLPTIFVRTARCNLRCVWCDSEYTFSGGEEIPPEEVLRKIYAYQIPAVCLTGGEPMLSKEIPALAQKLVSEGFAVSIFTNGTRPLDGLPPEVRKVVDLKPPSSKVDAPPRLSYLAPLDEKDVVKFVLCEENDYHWAKSCALEAGLLRREGERLVRQRGRPQLWLAPSFGELSPRHIVEWMLRDHLDARLNLQLHKFIWEPEARGV